jgi:hypothetical protein
MKEHAMSTSPDSNSNASRLASTVVIWALLLGAMIALSLILAPFLEEIVIAIPVIFTAAGVLLSGFIWQWGQMPNEAERIAVSESLKRNRLTLALRDLSDDELKRVRQRLASGDINDELAELLDDESEISKAKRR